MRKYFLAAVAAASLVTGHANANVTYDFFSGDFASVGNGEVQLVLTSTAPSFNLSGGTPGTPYSGDLDRFVSLTVDGLQAVTPSFRAGPIAFSMTLDSLGRVTSASLNYLGQGGDLIAIQSDPTECLRIICPSTGLLGSGLGALTPVPEPMSLALFGVGLAGLAAVRRRAAQA